MRTYKYPRTFHLPWSPGATNDDKVLSTDEHFIDKEVVVTIKMDGENTSMYHKGIHARSMDSANHPSRTFVKRIWAEKVMGIIGENVRVCGENLYAKHSIHYKNLEDYFLVFSAWENDVCLDWNETKLISDILELATVPVIYTGEYNISAIQKAFNDYVRTSKDEVEGYVVRLFDRFRIDDFGTSVVKYVRENHVQTGTHWMNEKVVRNELR